ncbi:unnamed protein product [Blepharisma stoltei]|uniref:Uncharacterized protein n=1 Tax=Blepharisma stoltei TaxID=1481888 RepID=A0AAU9IH11_9CILI|nr:unnamed protein product [Blepharisma stoltei]
MGLKADTLLFLLGGVANIIDLLTDIYYILTQHFASRTLYYASILFLVAPGILIVSLCILTTFYDLIRNKRRLLCFRAGLSLFFAFGEQTGLTLIIFAVYIYLNKSKREERELIDFMTKITGVIQGFIKSIPQIILQVYNGGSLGDWNYVLIISVGTSVFSLVYTCGMTLFLYDRITEKHVLPSLVDTRANYSFDRSNLKIAWDEDRKNNDSTTIELKARE